jgi:hypothetical protein
MAIRTAYILLTTSEWIYVSSISLIIEKNEGQLVKQKIKKSYIPKN